MFLGHLSSYLESAALHRLTARAARVSCHLNFFLDQSIKIRIEFGDRSAIHDGEPQSSWQAGQESAGFVLRDRGCAFVSQQSGDVLLPEANVLPGDPQMI